MPQIGFAHKLCPRTSRRWFLDHLGEKLLCSLAFTAPHIPDWCFDLAMSWRDMTGGDIANDPSLKATPMGRLALGS